MLSVIYNKKYIPERNVIYLIWSFQCRKNEIVKENSLMQINNELQFKRVF